MQRTSHLYSSVTVAAIAILAFIGATVSHEALGHGGMCVALGGRVTLLTSVYFRCSPGWPLVDAAGPLMNLAVGAICWGILRAARSLPLTWKLFFAFAVAFNLFWGSGYFIFSGLFDAGDWAYVLRDLALRPAGFWRAVMVLAGIVLYVRSVTLTARYLPRGVSLVGCYVAVGAVSCLAALFYSGAVLPALTESVKESFGAGVGLLWIASWRSRRSEPSASSILPPQSRAWLIAGVLGTLVFIATLGRGLILNGV
ncbi:MAG: hypothetical protein ACR2HH_06780 [Chthoniobacterales bacterium]